jgi:hypothetical protein
MASGPPYGRPPPLNSALRRRRQPRAEKETIVAARRVARGPIRSWHRRACFGRLCRPEPSRHGPVREVRPAPIPSPRARAVERSASTLADHVGGCLVLPPADVRADPRRPGIQSGICRALRASSGRTRVRAQTHPIRRCGEPVTRPTCRVQSRRNFLHARRDDRHCGRPARRQRASITFEMMAINSKRGYSLWLLLRSLTLFTRKVTKRNM